MTIKPETIAQFGHIQRMIATLPLGYDENPYDVVFDYEPADIDQPATVTIISVHDEEGNPQPDLAEEAHRALEPRHDT